MARPRLFRMLLATTLAVPAAWIAATPAAAQLPPPPIPIPTQPPGGGGGPKAADLSLDMAADPEQATVGEDLTITITIRNRGPSAVPAHVSGTIPIPANLVSITPEGVCDPTLVVLNCTTPTLSRGDVYVITIVARPELPGAVLCAATVRGPGLLFPDPMPLNNGDAVLVIVGPPGGGGGGGGGGPTPTPTPSPSPVVTTSPVLTPIGGVDTGAGGAGGGLGAPALIGLGGLLGLVGTLALRRRRQPR